MANHLLQTKLYVPSIRSERVLRPRLLERLHQGLDRKLTLVSAPPGSGKTTLLSEWAGRCASHEPEIRVAWLALDEDDNDAPRFWTYFIAALQAAVQTVQPDLGQESRALLQAPQMPPLQTVLVPLLNDLAASPDKVLLVLDDYHLLASGKAAGDATAVASHAIHEGLTYLLDHLPQSPNGGLHLVLSTRADPPLPLYRLRGRGELNELRAADLRFTPDETAALLNEVMGLELAPDEIDTLEARTEGWIVGLQLAALSLQGRADRRAFIETFGGSHHYVLEYLTEEVVRRQSEPVRRFLVQTAILDRLCGSLCDAVRFGDVGPPGERDGETVLADLHARNLFVVPLDAERRWYRYHHLFADLLRNLLRKERAPDKVRELHLRASAWYERENDLDNAIPHALRAMDTDRAAGLIEQGAQTLISQGRLTTLIRWLDALPEATLHARPRLRFYQGWALNLSGQIEAAEQILLNTQATLSDQPPSAENEALRARLAALLTGIATLRQDTATVIRQAREALAYLPQEDLISRARVYVALGTAYAYQDRTLQAHQTWQQARDLALQAHNLFLATAAIELLAGTLIYHHGGLHAGAQELRIVLDLAAAPGGKLLPFSGTAHTLLADVYLEWNDLDAAASYLDTGVALLRQSGIGYGQIHTYCAQARLARARGDAKSAQRALQQAGKALDAHTMWHMVLHLAACQVRLSLWMGDVESAARWAACDPAVTRRTPPETLPRYLREVQHILQARVHLARGDAAQALRVLDGLEEQALAAGRRVQAMEACLLKALAWQVEGQSAAALAALERSLSWAEPEGYLRLYLEAGPDVIPLLRRAADREIQPQYAHKLLTAFGPGAPGLPTSPRAGAQSTQTRGSLVEPLTPRELEVLRLICEGLSNREITDRLTVTLNTVKKHTSNLYSKLGVRSRTQAIARAQSLDLL